MNRDKGCVRCTTLWALGTCHGGAVVFALYVIVLGPPNRPHDVPCLQLQHRTVVVNFSMLAAGRAPQAKPRQPIDQGMEAIHCAARDSRTHITSLAHQAESNPESVQTLGTLIAPRTSMPEYTALPSLRRSGLSLRLHQLSCSE